MPTKSLAKHERVVESVRRGLVGAEAVEFVRQSGYAITEAGVVRSIQAMGGRGRILVLIDEGKSNVEILQAVFPSADMAELKAVAARQAESRTAMPEGNTLVRPEDQPLYETAKMTVHLPADVYEAVRLAARAEGKSQNQMIVDLLTWALSRLPHRTPSESDLTDRPQ